jgi:hypothetical protein
LQRVKPETAVAKHKPARHRPEVKTTEPEPLELKLEDEEQPPHARTVTKLKGGYDPYDRDPARKNKPQVANHEATDLRKLSEWIRLKREVEELKQKEEAAAIALRKKR